jgi:hypothetical protein
MAMKLLMRKQPVPERNRHGKFLKNRVPPSVIKVGASIFQLTTQSGRKKIPQVSPPKSSGGAGRICRRIALTYKVLIPYT